MKLYYSKLAQSSLKKKKLLPLESYFDLLQSHTKRTLNLLQNYSKFIFILKVAKSFYIEPIFKKLISLKSC